MLDSSHQLGDSMTQNTIQERNQKKVPGAVGMYALSYKHLINNIAKWAK